MPASITRDTRSGGNNEKPLETDKKKGDIQPLRKEGRFFSYKYTCFFFSISSELSCKPQQAHEIPNTLHARYETSCRVPLTTNHGNALHTAVRRMRTAWLICRNVKKKAGGNTYRLSVNTSGGLLCACTSKFRHRLVGTKGYIPAKKIKAEPKQGAQKTLK